MKNRRACCGLRLLRKTVVGLGLFAAAAVLTWHGAGLLARWMNRVEPSPVSFAEDGATAQQLATANHAPATAGGSFRVDVSIGEANVRGVPVWSDSAPEIQVDTDIDRPSAG